jgi:hypothetical protein
MPRQIVGSFGGRSRARTADLLLVSLPVLPYIADFYRRVPSFQRHFRVSPALIEQHSEQQFAECRMRRRGTICVSTAVSRTMLAATE